MTTTMRRLLSLLLLHYLTPAWAALSEREILQEFYVATGGDSWNKNHGWEDNKDNLCDWHGVVCVGEEDQLDGNNRQRDLATTETKVIGLQLKDNNLSGRTPASLYELPRLQELSLSFNANLDVSFLGSENAQNLRLVKIHSTGITSLNGISGLKSTLEALHMSGTELPNTALPGELFLLTNLQNLHMADCQLEGKIPDEISKLSSLKQVNFLGNSLTGTLPFSFSNLQQLSLLTVSGNKFTGTIPGFLETFTNLEELYLDGNQFTGTLPAFSNLREIQNLYLNFNYLTGSIPTNFLSSAVHTNLRVDLSGNRLSGSIPATLDTLQDKEFKITLSDNLLDGVDASLCDNVKWMDGHVETKGCDAIACPVGTYGSIGRATESHSCETCDSGLFVGQSYCLDSDDVSVLAAVYAATGGANWIEDENWMTDENVCEWYGVTCWDTDDAKKGRVRHLELDGNNLVGSIPQSIYALETLTTVSISRNKVVMPFDNIGSAPHMRKINVASTDTVQFDGIENAQDFFAHLIADQLSLNGPIPPQIYQLSNLLTLSMSNCGLSGSISSDVGKMTSLESLYLYGNNLSGPLPSALSSLGALKILSLSRNKMNGVLPNALGSMTSLQALSLSDQVSKGGGMSGEVITFAENKELTTLHLAGNLFEGQIPSDLLRGADLDAPLTVDLSSNLLTGTVPGALSRFDSLNLMVEDNYITGIDKRLCVMDGWMNGNVRDYGCDAILCPAATTASTGRRMFDNEECRACAATSDGLEFYGQTTCGQRDVILSEREILELLYETTDGSNWNTRQNWNTNFHFCDWYGISCDDAKSVVSIVLGSNGLRGTVPTVIYQLPNLARVSLFSNPVEFSFDGIENARNLKSLILDETGLKSLEGVGQARGLKELNVRFNKLQGTIPTGIQRLVHLEALELSNNQFNGGLPSWLGKLPVLETFVAAHNDISGPLSDFGSFENLAFLDLSDNALTGHVPETFLEDSNANEKIFVDLSKNMLSGTVPKELKRLKRLSIRLTDNKIEQVDKALCSVDGWNDGDVGDYGCDGILCPAGTYSTVGRQSTDENKCESCKQVKYMGSTTCGSSGALRVLSSLGALGTVLVSTVYLVF